jgi:hypothetical protein
MKNRISHYLGNISEKVNPEDVDLSSFAVQKTLNPKIWGPKGILKPEVRKHLIKIAQDFLEFLDTPWVEYVDIIFTGSLANYNWSNFSDIDLHILINRGEINDNLELVDEYLSAKKKLWINDHKIKIYGFDVECYAQDVNEEHASSGVYSILNNKWLVIPSKEKPQLDKTMIKRKAALIMSKIDDIVKLNTDGKYNDVLSEYKILWDKIKKMRQSGLDRAGEFSYENIVFKILRRTDYIEKLTNTKLDAYDKLNSIK